MVNQEAFQAFIDKRFKQDEPVTAHSLGVNMPGEFDCIVRGINGCEPFEMYIVEWLEIERVKKFYPKGTFWTHSVLPKGCLRSK